ncbi:MAG: metallophosphoesterase family protein [Fibrobacteria bacterium]|nr:metallophosphoesterase family protein [Fibrobacteria bacterium]
MIYGIFSDIHSNLIALEQVLKSMDDNNVEQKICLGDAVGYGPFPNECIELIQSVSSSVILGNHDSVALGRESSYQFNFFARNAIEWTKNELSDKSIDTMQKWPYLTTEEKLTFVHASPRSPADWTYIATLDEAVDAFSYFSNRVCFIGHTHLPVIVIMEGEQSFFVSEYLEHKVLDNQRILVNVGSVGQPRDGIPTASWCLCDSSNLTVKIMRVPYDIHKTQKVMRQKGLDDFLINRLAIGK